MTVVIDVEVHKWRRISAVRGKPVITCLARPKTAGYNSEATFANDVFFCFGREAGVQAGCVASPFICVAGQV